MYFWSAALPSFCCFFLFAFYYASLLARSLSCLSNAFIIIGFTHISNPSSFYECPCTYLQVYLGFIHPVVQCLQVLYPTNLEDHFVLIRIVSLLLYRNHCHPICLLSFLIFDHPLNFFVICHTVGRGDNIIFFD